MGNIEILIGCRPDLVPDVAYLFRSDAIYGAIGIPLSWATLGKRVGIRCDQDFERKNVEKEVL